MKQTKTYFAKIYVTSSFGSQNTTSQPPLLRYPKNVIFRRNVTAMASRWQHSVRFDLPEI